MLSSVCQQFNILGEHPLPQLAWYGVRMNCGIRTQLRRTFWSPNSGETSRFAEGDWTRMLDDSGVFRPISRTVLLEGVNCGGIDGSHGCGKECPLMFRDEWLVPAAAPVQSAERAAGSLVRVRSEQEIRATLDWLGKRG